jgi:hypothetical protein
MQNFFKSALIASAVLASSIGYAQTAAYVGLDAYKDNDSKVGPGITFGMKFATTLGAELSYREAKASLDRGVKLQVIRLVAVGELPMGNGAAFFGDIGVANVKAGGYGYSEHKTGFAAALGFKYYFTKQASALLKYEYNGPAGYYSAGPVLGLQYQF